VGGVKKVIPESVLRMIDDDTLESRIYDEWRERSEELLEKLEKEMCEKYGLSYLGWWGSDGVNDFERRVKYYRPDLQDREKRKAFSWDRERHGRYYVK
jgi:hypothetical protein